MRKVTQHSNEGLKGKQNPRSEPFVAKVLQQEAAQKLTRTNVFDACGANLAAGSDTTGISLGAALYYLYKNPDKLAKLRQEIDGGLAAGQVSDPVTFQESQRMPYLQAVIKEALRLHPAVGTILARDVPEGGTHLAGQYFPGGVSASSMRMNLFTLPVLTMALSKTQVGANVWVLHYDPQIYGPDSYSFRPERWLEDDGSKALKESMFFPVSVSLFPCSWEIQTNLLASQFGAGSRTCIGKNISLLEMSKVIPQIVREFDLEFEHPDQSWEVFCSWFVWPEYKCRVHHRPLAV